MNYMKDGRTLYTAHSKISADGNSMTIIGKGMSLSLQSVETLTVYDKQK